MAERPNSPRSDESEILPDAPPARRRNPPDPAKETKTPPPKWRTYVARGALIIAGLLLVLELVAQVRFNQHLKICQEAVEAHDGKHTLYEELKDRFPSQPTKSTGVRSFAPSDIYSWSWRGVRSYKLSLYVNPVDGTVFDVASVP